MGGCRKDVPGGVGDIKRICERVAGRACKRMRTLLEMGERGPEVLEELSVWFLAVESAHISQRRAQVHGERWRATRANHMGAWAWARAGRTYCETWHRAHSRS
jgi:hypothetical protein